MTQQLKEGDIVRCSICTDEDFKITDVYRDRVRCQSTKDPNFTIYERIESITLVK